MSKTGGNAIWLEDSAVDMYAKVMAISDGFILNYFTLATNTPLEDIERIKKDLADGANPMHIKKQLATKIVTELHSSDAAKSAEEYFEKIVQRKEIPTDIQEIQLTADDEELLNEDFLVEIGMASSKSDAKRLFEQGGVELDGERVLDPKANKEINDGAILKIGKRRIVKIKHA
jgi:tyrosyl-tRNA synthetase